MTQTCITDLMKVVMAIKVTTIDTTYEPEDRERLRELRNPLPWSDDGEERTLHITGTGYTFRIPDIHKQR